LKWWLALAIVRRQFGIYSAISVSCIIGIA
jgi:hypothetical protein